MALKMTDDTFQNRYHELEVRMKALAEQDGDVYVPNPEPVERVDYLFICMEPSLGGWARDKTDAVKKVELGFRNFLNGYDPMILHYSIRRFLCKGSQRYHITDFSKGAMLVELAGVARKARYQRWYPLLKDEVELIAKDDAKYFAVGRNVENHLSVTQFPRKVTRLLHYSPRADRKASIREHEEAFNEFVKTVSHDDVLSVAREIVEESLVPEEIRKFVFTTLEKRTLTNSRLQLMFNYKMAFEAIA